MASNLHRPVMGTPATGHERTGLVVYLVLSALYCGHMWFAVSLMVSLRVIAARLIGVDGRPIALAGGKR